MNRNTIILIAMAVGTAIMVAAMMQARVGNPADDQIEILVAGSDMPAGSTVTVNDFIWQPWREDLLPINAIGREDFLYAEDQALRLRRGVRSGEPVLSNLLVDPGDAGFLAAALGQGHRAVSIPVDAETSVAGFVRPGDWVDVILTYEVRLRNNGQETSQLVVARHATETVLSNVRVLAVDQVIEDLGSDAQPGRTVTLEVEPQQAERLALAGRMGDLSLSLRGMGDEADAVDEDRKFEFTADIDVGKALRAAAIANMGAVAPRVETSDDEEVEAAPAAPATIRLYHGSSSSTMTIHSY